MLPLPAPLTLYTGLDGYPLDAGFIYFGRPNQNPETAPITVYWDEANTQPALQPLRTLNGYIVRNGTPANVYYRPNYSITIRDRNRALVVYAKTSTQEYTSLREFGVVGDGIADDTVALQAAMDSDVYQIDTKNLLCRITSPVVQTKPHMWVNLRVNSECDPTLIAVKITGSAGAAVSLTANAAKGAFSVNVPNGLLFTPGEWLYLRSTDNWSVVAGVKDGELCKIRDVIGNTVYVYDAIMVAYTTAATASATPISMLRRNVVHNMLINGEPAIVSQYGLWLEMCDESVVSNQTSNDFQRAHNTLSRCGTVVMLGGNGSRTGVNVGLNYGIVVQNACYNILIDGYTGNDMRHAVTVGGTQGITRSVKVHNSYSYGSLEAGFDSHAACNYFEVVSSTVVSNGTAPSNIGCTSQGANTVIRGCTFIDCIDAGVFSQPMVFAPVVTSLLVEGCFASNNALGGTTDSFVLATTDNAERPFDSVTVINNRCKGMPQIAYIYANAQNIVSAIVDNNTQIGVTSSRAVYFRANDTFEITNGSICGNTAVGDVGATEGIYLQGLTTGRVKNIKIDGNNITGFVNSLRTMNTVNCVEGTQNRFMTPTTSVRTDSGSTGMRKPSSQGIGMLNTDIVMPADTTEDILATIPVPAYYMGLNGRLRIRTLWTCTSSANAKTMRIRMGAAAAGLAGTLLYEVIETTLGNISRELMVDICNRSAANSQIAYSGAITVANRTAAIDTTAATEIVITGQKAVAGETLTLRTYSIELLPN